MGRLFKELMVMVNSHASTPNEGVEIAKSVPILKCPSLQKRKSKLTKSQKEPMEAEDGKELTHELGEAKIGKKHTNKHERKELIREEQEKHKQLIFSDYPTIMTYKVHQEMKSNEKPSHSGCQPGDAN